MKKYAIVLLLCAFTVSAQELDLAVAGDHWLCGVGVPLVRGGFEFSPGLVEQDTNITTIAAGAGGRLLAAIDGTDVEIVRVHRDLTRTPFFAGVAGSQASLFVADADGTVFVLTSANALLEISPTGALLHNRPFPFTARSIDLAADQCTLFAADTAGRLRRHNVCANTPLPDFLPSNTAESVRILPDGGLLVTRSLTSVIDRYDAAGTLVDTYDLAPYFPGAIAIGNGGTSLLAAADCDRRVIEVDLATGTVLREIPQQFVDRAYAIVSGRGYTAAIGALAASDVPLTGPVFLLTLGVVLAFAAVWRMH